MKPGSLPQFALSSSSLLVRGLLRHPRRITLGVGAILLGTGVTAFGIAPLAPDAADLPVQQVVESVTPVLTDPLAQAKPPARFELFHSDLTRRNDSVQSLLKRLGVSDSEAVTFLVRIKELLEDPQRALLDL